MHSHRLLLGARRASALAALAVVFVAASACDAVLGIKDVSLDPTLTGGGGGAASTSSTSAQGGGGGQIQGDFAFSIAAVNVNVPYDGRAFVDVEITPEGGFKSAVDVVAKGAPTGFILEDGVIPAGQTKARIKVGAEGALTLGSTFDLELVGQAGALSHSDKVPAVVTGKPGSIDMDFGAGGVTTWPLNISGGDLYDIRVVAQDKILVAGRSATKFNWYMEGARLLADGNLDPSFNAGGKLAGTVQPPFCDCSEGEPQTAVGAFRFVSGIVTLVGHMPRVDHSEFDISVVRFNDNGTPSPLAGDTGLKLVDIGGSEYVADVAMTGDEKFVAVGDILGADTAFVTRFDHFNGLDMSFSGNGFLKWPMRLEPKVVIDSQERVVVIAYTGSTIYVDRLNENGSLDVSVELQNPMGGPMPSSAVAVLPNGGLLVVGRVTIDVNDRATALWYLNPDLSLTDLGPGKSNPVILDPTTGTDDPVDVKVLADGRVLVLGSHSSDGPPFLARVLPEGDPDATFGTAGVLDVSLGQGGLAGALTTTTSGRILVAATSSGVPKVAIVAQLWN